MVDMRLLLFALPAVLFALSLLVSPRLLSKLAPVVLWTHVFAMFYLLFDILAGSKALLAVAPGLSIDRLAACFQMLTQIVVASALTHGKVFLEQDQAFGKENERPVRILYACSSLFLIAMTCVFMCQNLGFLWIAIEATTLCSAPLIYYHGTKHSLEAAWKYVIICSVGIAFALFGTILVFASSQHGAVLHGSLDVEELKAHATSLQYPLLRLGFLFCLLGYGTKAGMFPLHSWLPDAHSEAPAPASAMLSGGLLNCALFAIWRLSEILRASQHAAFVEHALISVGSVTLVAASIFLVRQHGIKRLFAYSSIENVGLMLISIGTGFGQLFFLLAANHSIAKVALFLTAGNIIQSTGSKSISEIKGVLVRNPRWAAILLLGAIAVTGAPPFGAFVAEWMLITRSASAHLWIVMGCLLGALTLSFLAVLFHVGRIVCGTPADTDRTFGPWSSTIVPAGLLVVSFLLGVTSLSQLML